MQNNSTFYLARKPVDLKLASQLSFQSAHLVGLAEERVGATALVDDVPDQVLLAVVGGQDADAVGRVAQQAHVHVEGHRILGLGQILSRTREKCCLLKWGQSLRHVSFT